MLLLRPALCVTLLFTIQAHATAGDLRKIDRTIGKEPVYQSKPKYCLLVFGPEAKSRVWFVLDGVTLFTSGKDGELRKYDRQGNSFVLRIPGTSQNFIVEVIRRDGTPVGVKLSGLPGGFELPASVTVTVAVLVWPTTTAVGFTATAVVLARRCTRSDTADESGLTVKLVSPL